MLVKKFIVLCLLFCSILSFAKVEVQLAKEFTDNINVKEYLVSEKYDGVRAIWTGKVLVTRQGNPINAPGWFTKELPNVWLDGELWSKRNDFSYVISTVSKDSPVNDEWQKIKYMVFDAPDSAKSQTFEERYSRYSNLINRLDLPHVKPVEQFSIQTNEALSLLLKEKVSAGAEGLILHRKSALFKSGRTGNLIKLKPYMDAEAKVVEVLGGSGKYLGKMGAILVEMPSGIRFKIGTGFSDEERANPPKIGDQITYRFHGYTKNGIPRFASFLRIRDTAY